MEEGAPELINNRQDVSGSSVVGYAFAGKHSWPPSWVGAQFRRDTVSGSTVFVEASRQGLSLRTRAGWKHVALVPGNNTLVVRPELRGFFVRPEADRFNSKTDHCKANFAV